MLYPSPPENKHNKVYFQNETFENQRLLQQCKRDSDNGTMKLLY